MAWFRDGGLLGWILTGLVSGGLLALLAGYVGLVVYTALRTGAPVVGALLDLAFPTLAVASVLLVVAVVSVVGFVRSLASRASIPRSDALGAAAERAERAYPPLRTLGLSDRLSPPEPSAEERARRTLEELKRQYVEGEIDEAEFERRVDRLVANESIDAAEVSRERRRVVEDGRN